MKCILSFVYLFLLYGKQKLVSFIILHLFWRLSIFSLTVSFSQLFTGILMCYSVILGWWPESAGEEPVSGDKPRHSREGTDFMEVLRSTRDRAPGRASVHTDS